MTETPANQIIAGCGHFSEGDQVLRLNALTQDTHYVIQFCDHCARSLKEEIERYLSGGTRAS